MVLGGRAQPIAIEVFSAATSLIRGEGDGRGTPRVFTTVSSGASASAHAGSGRRVTRDVTAPQTPGSVDRFLAAFGREEGVQAPDAVFPGAVRESDQLSREARIRVTAEAVEAAAAGALDAGATDVRVRVSHATRDTVVWSPETRTYERATENYGRVRVTARRRGTEGSASWGGRWLPSAELAYALGLDAAVDAGLEDDLAAPPGGRTAVLLGPSPAGYLIHEAIGHALEGTRSGSRNRLRHGAPALASGLIVVETPCDQQAWVAARIDDEGVATRRTVLLEEGRVVRTLTTRSDDTLDDRPAGGNARRADHTSRAQPRMRHTVLLEGSAARADVLADTSDGVLVVEVDFATADTATGAFSLHVSRSRRIEHGILGPRLQPHVVRGDIADLKRIDICSDAAVGLGICGRGDQWLPVSYSAPTLRLPSLTIDGSGAS